MTYTAARPVVADPLHFRPVTIDAVDDIRRCLAIAPERTCDYTVGGIYMWVDYFGYSYCIVRDTLFIRGVAEDDLSRTAYSLPVGRMPLAESVELLRRHCRTVGDQLRFSAVPGDRIGQLADIVRCAVTPLDGWSDYLYDAVSLATQAGNHLKKKRNHVNRFMADNPGAVLEPLDSAGIPQAKELLLRLAADDDGMSPLASAERTQVMAVLDNWDVYSRVFEGGVLRDSAGRMAAFTIGEVIGDTLFVHIEKIDHAVAGAGETVNKMFAARMTGAHPEVRYINREEDVGDPGLRAAKQSYHPLMLLPKFNVVCQ